MEVELELKVTRPADESTSKFQLKKDHAGPLFLFHETESVFALTSFLRGYRLEDIKIEISEDGKVIAITGEKRVDETIIIGWKVKRNEGVREGFKKAFRIPDNVNLDKIKARFDEDESVLTIKMPKRIMGIHGSVLKEISETGEEEKSGLIEKPESSNGDDNETVEKISEDEKVHNQETMQDVVKQPEKPEITWPQKEEESYQKPVSGHSDKTQEIDKNGMKLVENKETTEDAVKKAETPKIKWPQKEEEPHQEPVSGYSDEAQNTQEIENDAMKLVENQESMKNAVKQIETSEIACPAKEEEPVSGHSDEAHKAQDNENDGVKLVFQQEKEKKTGEASECQQEKQSHHEETESMNHDRPGNKDEGRTETAGEEMEMKEFLKLGSKQQEQNWKSCVIAGSALLVSLVVFVIHTIKRKQQKKSSVNTKAK